MIGGGRRGGVGREGNWRRRGGQSGPFASLKGLWGEGRRRHNRQACASREMTTSGVGG